MPFPRNVRCWLLTLAAAILTVTVVPANPARAHHDSTSVVVVSTTEWGPDSIGYHHIVGEVRNTGRTNLSFVELTFEFFDAGGRLLSTDFTYAAGDVLEPGQSSPFATAYERPYGYHHFRVTPEADVTADQSNRNFDVVVTNQFNDVLGWRHVVGQVTNRNAITADFVEVHLSLRSPSGQLVDTESTYVDTNSSAQVAPGDTVPFEVTLVPGPPAYSSIDVFADSPTAPTLPRSGYWMVDTDGNVFGFGNAEDHGGAFSFGNVIDIAPTPSFNGYWLVDEDGQVTAAGDAVDYGDIAYGALAEDEFVTSLSPTRSGRGYWIFTTRGRVVTFGDAVHLGDMSRTPLQGPVYDSIPTPSGAGYYMVASDGGIFAFGDAKFYGSMGGKDLNAPVMSLVPDRDGVGYWLVASDGGIFAFQASFRGSMGGKPLNQPVTGMVPFGNGYLMVGADGGIFNFSDKEFFGSLGGHVTDAPIFAVAALDES